MSALDRFIVAFLLASGFQSPSSANVIYDVSIDYGAVANFSFSMEFLAVDTEGKIVPLQASDLISSTPAFDFFNESLVYGGVPLTLDTDEPTTMLSFIAGNSPGFESSDYFIGSLPNIGPIECFFQSSLSLYCDDGGKFTPLFVTQVSIRQRGSSVPVPSTLPLLAIGLAGLGLMSRSLRSPRKRSA